MECSQRNGRIDGYRLIYYPTGNSGDMESILIDGSYTDTFTIVGLQPRVDYTLNLTAASGNYTLFSEESSIISKLTSTPPGKHQTPLILPIMLKNIITHAAVGFLFQGRLYGNNSIVSLAEIGEGRDALLCITNETVCCKSTNVPSPMREWFFPNGTSIKIEGEKHNFYRNRDSSIVRFNRRNNAISPTGIFKCIIPISIQQSKIITSTIHIGIYDIGKGNLCVYYHDINY